MEVTKATKWEEFGGKRWTKGKYDRVYFNINALAGWNSFKKELSNTDQWKLQYAKIFVDLTDGDKYSIEFGSSNRDHYKILDFITNALNEIRAKIEAEKEAEKKALEAKSEEVESKAESNEKTEKAVEPKKCFKAICEERFENGIPLPPFPIPTHKPDWYRKMEKEQKEIFERAKNETSSEMTEESAFCVGFLDGVADKIRTTYENGTAREEALSSLELCKGYIRTDTEKAKFLMQCLASGGKLPATLRYIAIRGIKEEIEREYLQSKGREEAFAYLDTLADDVSAPKAREGCKKILLEFGAKKRRTV